MAKFKFTQADLDRMLQDALNKVLGPQPPAPDQQKALLQRLKEVGKRFKSNGQPPR